MLIRFRVTNYASIRDEAELSMVTVGEHGDIAVRPAGDSGVKALPVAAIYGPNASGKSNILSALVFMRGAVRNSHQLWRPGDPIARRAFKLDATGAQHPTRFIIDFVMDGTRYEYGFAVDDSHVIDEWLSSYPKKRHRLLFERTEESSIKFGPSLTGARQDIAKLMRPNSLYLSTAAANNHPLLSRVYEWFTSHVIATRAGNTFSHPLTLHEWKYSDREPLRALLRFADTGVIDLDVKEQETPGSIDENLLEFIHQGKDKTASMLMDEESSGTLAWLHLLGPVVTAIRQGGILVVDELDAHLHPLLSAHLVNIFQDRQTNTTGAQLIFNTHNVSLLGPSAPGRLRRDQVWFTEKDDTGATKLIALAEYRVRDGLENIEKRYLAGRYGAIPFLDDIALDSLRGE